ncbi:MAG: hypothetical protein QNK37_38080, partial [Acidobacteriota bacterium]|nr:hypothetical protein [Acidobacteriota bacterium]
MLFAFFLFLQQEPEQVDPSRWIMDQIRTYQQSGQLPEAKEAVLAAVQEQPIANYNYDQLQELVGLFYTLNERKKGDEILSRIPDTALNGPHLFNRCYDVAERMDGKTLNVMIAKLGRERPDYALDAVHNSFAQRVVFHYKGTQKERAFLETLARGPEKIDTFFLPLFLYSQWLWSPSDKERDAALDQLFASELPFASRYRLLALSKLPASESGWELELLDKEISGLKQKLADPPQFKNRRQRNNWEGRTNYHLAYAYALKAESAQAKKDYTAAKKWVEAASGLDVFQRFLDNESSWFYERVILDGFKEYHSLAARIYMAEGDLEKATRSMGRAYLQDKERRAEFKDFYTRWKGSTKGLDSFLYTLNDDNRSPMPSLTLEAL